MAGSHEDDAVRYFAMCICYLGFSTSTPQLNKYSNAPTASCIGVEYQLFLENFILGTSLSITQSPLLLLLCCLSCTIDMHNTSHIAPPLHIQPDPRVVHYALHISTCRQTKRQAHPSRCLGSVSMTAEVNLHLVCESSHPLLAAFLHPAGR